MKIMIVTPYFYPKVGGLENYVFNIAKGLKKRGHDVLIVTSNHETKEYIEDSSEGLRVIRLPADFRISNTPIGLTWRSRLKKIIKDEQPDVINAHTPVPYIADIALRVSGQIPTVLTYHNDLVKPHGIGKYTAKLFYILLLNKTMRKADKIVVTSEYYANISPYLLKHKEKLYTVEPGVETRHFNTQANKEWLKNMYPAKKIVLFVGSMDSTNRHKGVDVLLKAVAKTKKEISNVQLVAVGKGDAVDSYKTLANALGISSNVSFTGFVSDNDLPQYYAGADLLVLPSTTASEGFGMVIIEAAACGIPAVGSKIGGIPFAIKNGVTGELARPGSVTDLSMKIINLLSNPAKLEAYGSAGAKRVHDNYDWSVQVNKTMDIFKRAVMPKVCLVHNIISPYRLPVYEAVSKEVDLTVLFCKPITKDRVWTYDLSEYTFKYKILKGFSVGPVIFNTNALSALINSKFNVIMANSDPDIAPTAILGFILAKLRSRKILVWSLVTDENIHFFPTLAYTKSQPHKLLRGMISWIVMLYRRLCFSLADHFLAFSQEAQAFLEDKGVARNSISRTQQIMPSKLLPSPTRKMKRTGRTFLYLGYLNERKGVNYLIEAFQRLTNSEARLIIAGIGPMEATLKKQAKKDDRISFTGYVEGEAKANLYASADIFVLPTLLDVWGLVINEAIYYGLAIICSDAAVAKEIIDKNVGKVFKSTDILKLQTDMETMINDQVTLRRIQKFNARNFAVADVSVAAGGYISAAKKALL
ncbi:MAG TPA: glycosyltransferase family 4 protein [Candidatus Saccharimonadales bacterium]